MYFGIGAWSLRERGPVLDEKVPKGQALHEADIGVSHHGTAQEMDIDDISMNNHDILLQFAKEVQLSFDLPGSIILHMNATYQRR